jgi:hypothetical protein
VYANGYPASIPGLHDRIPGGLFAYKPSGLVCMQMAILHPFQGWQTDFFVYTHKPKRPKATRQRQQAKAQSPKPEARSPKPEARSPKFRADRGPGGIYIKAQKTKGNNPTATGQRPKPKGQRPRAKGNRPTPKGNNKPKEGNT